MCWYMVNLKKSQRGGGGEWGRGRKSICDLSPSLPLSLSD
jgi:hypothetical protein